MVFFAKPARPQHDSFSRSANTLTNRNIILGVIHAEEVT